MACSVAVRPFFPDLRRFAHRPGTLRPDLRRSVTAKGKKSGQNVTFAVSPDDEGEEKGLKCDRDR